MEKKRMVNVTLGRGFDGVLKEIRALRPDLEFASDSEIARVSVRYFWGYAKASKDLNKANDSRLPKALNLQSSKGSGTISKEKEKKSEGFPTPPTKKILILTNRMIIASIKKGDSYIVIAKELPKKIANLKY